MIGGIVDGGGAVAERVDRGDRAVESVVNARVSVVERIGLGGAVAGGVVGGGGAVAERVDDSDEARGGVVDGGGGAG